MDGISSAREDFIFFVFFIVVTILQVDNNEDTAAGSFFFFNPEVLHIHLADLQQRVFSIGLNFLEQISVLLVVEATAASCP